MPGREAGVKRGCDTLLGSAAGVRLGWRPKVLEAAEALERLRSIGWLSLDNRGELIKHRAWSHSAKVRRIDAAFSDGSLVSVRWLKQRISVQLSRWSPS